MARALSLVLVVLAACGDATPQPTAIQRGAAVFGPVARKLGQAVASDLKKSDPAGFARYLQEIGGKEEADLVKKVGDETLVHYADALSISSAKESDLKAGRFDDAMNERKVKDALEKFSKSKSTLPHLCKVLADLRKTEGWATGLELEFTARVLEGQLLESAQ
jgi:hypothetical protein